MTTWKTVDGIVDWLDAESPVTGDQGTLLRVLKIVEEAGEVAQAVIGATGQNPRKGTSHTWDDVHTELVDVIVTSMVALRSLTPDAEKLFESRLQELGERSQSAKVPLPEPS